METVSGLRLSCYVGWNQITSELALQAMQSFINLFGVSLRTRTDALKGSRLQWKRFFSGMQKELWNCLKEWWAQSCIWRSLFTGGHRLQWAAWGLGIYGKQLILFNNFYKLFLKIVLIPLDCFAMLCQSSLCIMKYWSVQLPWCSAHFNFIVFILEVRHNRIKTGEY